MKTIGKVCSGAFLAAFIIAAPYASAENSVILDYDYVSALGNMDGHGAGIESGNIVINVVGHDKQRVYKVYTSDDLKSWIEVPGYRPNVNGEIKLPANRRAQFIKVE